MHQRVLLFAWDTCVGLWFSILTCYTIYPLSLTLLYLKFNLIFFSQSFYGAAHQSFHLYYFDQRSDTNLLNKIIILFVTL